MTTSQRRNRTQTNLRRLLKHLLLAAIVLTVTVGQSSLSQTTNDRLTPSANKSLQDKNLPQSQLGASSSPEIIPARNQPVTEGETQSRLDNFFSIRKSGHSLHPNKRSWALFALSHAGMGIAFSFANRSHATRSDGTYAETKASEIPAMAAVTGLDFLAFKFVSPALGTVGGWAGTAHYGYTATK